MIPATKLEVYTGKGRYLQASYCLTSAQCAMKDSSVGHSYEKVSPQLMTPSPWLFVNPDDSLIL